MAGHNRWSKVKHRKAVVDKRRSKAWSMCSRAIISAARQNGPDPVYNFLLRHAIDEARYYNMPTDNIERAIKKGAGGGDTEQYEHVRYEGYGPGGVAVVVEALTNNRTRTAGDVRNIFGDYAGKLGTTGCVAHQFVQKGRLVVISRGASEDEIFEAAVGLGADDCVRTDDAGGEPGTAKTDAPAWAILCAPERFAQVRAGVGELARSIAVEVGESGIDMIPLNSVRVSGEQADALAELLEAMEDNEDVRKVFDNAEFVESETPGR